MGNNDEITLSEAKRVTAELKASILKLDALNQNVVLTLTQMQDLDSKLKNYTSVLEKFEYKSEDEMTTNYGAYLAFLGKRIDELIKNSNLKNIEKIVIKADYIVNLSVVKVALIVAVLTTGINILILK
ncbi:hypothetical protein [Arcobacter sp.]|uniref:hypothetical protein n=1 Tax=Arcobacter sp. TaxID=1872629 RepID=UPI003D131713